MADPRSTSTRRAVLGYDQLKQLFKSGGFNAPDILVKDYQGIIQDFVFLADTADTFEIKINENADAIEINRLNFEAHDQSTSEHGVTGDNVGNGDYCTTSIGGVVLQMESIADAISSTQEILLADIPDAPASYNQGHAQLVSEIINDTKAKHNQLVVDFNAMVTQFNALIAESKTSKQMAG